MKDKSQKMEIVNFMKEVGVSVLVLQETKWTLGNAIWIVPGCVVCEHGLKNLGKGKVGIATMVSRDIRHEALEITDNMIWIRCGGGEKKLVM